MFFFMIFYHIFLLYLRVDNTVKEGKSYIFWNLDCQYPAVAVVGLGKKCKGYDDLERIDKDKEAVRIAAAVGCKALQEVGVKTICLDGLGDPEAAAEGSTLGLWKFQENKTKQKCPPTVNLYSEDGNALQSWNTGLIKAQAQNEARRLTDMPGNLMTPTIFAQNVEEMFKGLDVCIEIHDKEWAKKKKMNAFLSVSQGSSQPPKFLELSYSKGCPDDGPYTLIGKGVTFDSGGISLKPGAKMDEMRGDMGGAAVCVAALRALARLHIQTNIKVLVPLTENMPSSSALKPGDVIKAMNGKSICVDNTDAEGRLILADALVYSGCFKPKWVMDVATLTVGCKGLQEVGVKTICLDGLGDPEAAAEGSTLGLWKFQENKTKQKRPPTVNLYSGDDSALQSWNTGLIKAQAQNEARRLTDMPGNLMTPTIFAQNVEEMFKGIDVCIEIHDKEWAKKKNMNAFLSVSQGSSQPPKFLELSYSKGCPDDGPYTLIGKGVTFDSGGISLKPGAKMDEMRGDMGGAAACVAALRALACLHIPTNIKVLVPLTENMPSSSALKPGDVIKAMNKKSICVDNTDAEGRLILADALVYSGCFKPKWVMDVATLTGAMMVALGDSAAGVYTNSNKLYEFLDTAGSKTGDRVWRFPLWNCYTKEITDYPSYDVRNMGKGRGGGACTAAAFLKEFVPECVDWMHLDIAGIMGSGAVPIPYLAPGMTGRPTRTIIEFIQSQARIFK